MGLDFLLIYPYPALTTKNYSTHSGVDRSSYNSNHGGYRGYWNLMPPALKFSNHPKLGPGFFFGLLSKEDHEIILHFREAGPGFFFELQLKEEREEWSDEQSSLFYPQTRWHFGQGLMPKWGIIFSSWTYPRLLSASQKGELICFVLRFGKADAGFFRC